MAANPLPEVTAITMRMHDLMLALSDESVDVAGMLLSKGFVSEETMSKMLIVSYTPKEKATILIEAVRNNIKLTPSKFPELLEILSEATCAKVVAESLRSTYQSELIFIGTLSDTSELADGPWVARFKEWEGLILLKGT